MATWPPAIASELFYDNEWHDITPDVRLTADIEIELGRRNEGADAADPGAMTLTINNGRSRVNPGVSGRYSTKNPLSDLFGKIGKNTRIRIRVDEEPFPATPFLTDAFNRTETSGWGSADTGQPWFIQEFIDNGVNDSDYSVSSGLGHMLMDSVSPTSLRMMQATLVDKKADVDVTCTMQTDQRSVSVSGLQANFGGICARVSDDGTDFITGIVWFAADSGLPNGQGLRVATSIVAVADGSNAEEVQGTVIPGLTYEIGQPLNVRFQCEGPEMRMRVWSPDQPEPTLWHAQAHISRVTDEGDVALFTQGSAEGTTLPVTVSFGDLSVSDFVPEDDAVRGVFEIYEWPPRWDISDSDVWVPIVANGILRRLSQGDQPIQSALRRYIASLLPVAYWPLEDTGSIGQFAVEAVAGGQSMAVAGVNFAQDDDVPGSAALPELLDSTGVVYPGRGTSPFMVCSDVPAVDTGSWSVFLLFNIPADRFPTSGSHELLRVYSTGTGVTWLINAEQVSGTPGLRLRVFNEDGVVLGNVTASQGDSLAVSGPRLTNIWRVLALKAVQDGVNVDFRFEWSRIDGVEFWGNEGTYAGTAGHFSRINTTFSPSLAGMKFGHISAWGLRNPVGYFDALTNLHATLGFLGEEARERVRRLATEQNVASLIVGDASTPMGSQSIAPFNSLILEAATADIAVLTEQRNESGLLLRARELTYNQDPVLVLDYANGEVFSPFEPTDDDQRIQNSITASRDNGASATARQTEGPLNVNSPVTDPDGVGEYPATYSVNVESDDQLPSYAGWRLRLGTVDELRYPRVTLNLANERMRVLIDDIIRVREGSKIVIVNPPAWLPPDDIELIVEGYKEVLNAFKWEITLVCSPASPWNVGDVADDDYPENAGTAEPNRADTSLSRLATTIGTDDTTVYVDTVLEGTAPRAQWVNTMSPPLPYTTAYPDEFPFDIRLTPRGGPTGEVVQVDMIEPVGWDTFTRSVSNGWGTSDAGFAWAAAGGLASDSSVNGSSGVITLSSSPGTIRFQQLLLGFADVEVLVSMAAQQISTGASMLPGVLLRAFGEYYRARLHFGTSGTMFTSVARVGTQIGSSPALPWTYTAGQLFWVRVRIVGQRVLIRAWPDGAVEPEKWHNDQTVVTDPIEVGAIGLTCSAFAGNTNVNPSVRYDNFQVTTPQKFTVVRGVNGIVIPHGAGTDVRLAQPAIVAL